MTKTSASGNAPRRVPATRRVYRVLAILVVDLAFLGLKPKVKSGQTECGSNFAGTALADVLYTVGSMRRCAGLARRGSDAPGDLCHRFHLPRALARPRLVLGPRRAAKPLRATGQPRWGNLGCAWCYTQKSCRAVTRHAGHGPLVPAAALLADVRPRRYRRDAVSV